MKYAIEVDVFEIAEAHQAELLVRRALEDARLQRHSDYVSRVVLLATPHYATIISDLAQQAIRHTGCMNIWGGCVTGLIYQGRAIADEPALLVAVFDGDFEPSSEDQGVNLLLAQVDPEHVGEWTIHPAPQAGLVKQVNTLGLLSYGANYKELPRLEHGRLVGNPLAKLTLKAKKPLIFNSEGLEFFTELATVTECAGKFLLKVDNQLAVPALLAPSEQTRPVGLRLQVVRDGKSTWIAVMQLLADGTIALSQTLEVGDQVRLARRSPAASDADLGAWLGELAPLVPEQITGFGIIMAGFERSQLCHQEVQDIEALCHALPNVHWIGILGQAVWLSNEELPLLPARNNRLTLCLVVDNV